MRALLVPCTLCDILRWCPKGDKALCLFVQEVLSAYFTFISVSIRHLQSVNSSHSIGESSKQTIRMLCGKNTNSILPWKLQELGGGAPCGSGKTVLDDHLWRSRLQSGPDLVGKY